MSRFLRVVLLAAALVLGALAVAPLAQAAEEEYEGQVLGCSYALKADTGERSFSAEISSCSSSLDPEGTLEGSWKSAEEAGQTTVELETAKLSILGQERTFHLGYTFTLPVDLDELIETYEQVKQLQKEGKRTLKEVEEAKAKIKQRLEESVREFEAQVVIAAAEAVAGQVGDGLAPVGQKFNELVGSLNEPCEAFGTDFKNPFCSPYDPTVKCGASCPVPASGNVGSLAEGAAEAAGESDADQAALCPVFNSVQDDAVFVCVPSFVQGNLETGDKPLVIVGGGALMMIPGLSGESKISSNTAIVELGGAVVGDTLTFKAPDIALAGGAQDAIGNLSLEGKSVSIGQIDGESLLSGISALPQDWHSEIVEQAALHTTFSAPDLLGAGRTTVKAEESFVLASGSRIDGSGRGGHGGDFETGIDPTGESEYFGASHGGLGGYPIASLGTQNHESWYTMEGRSPVFDNPFKPTEPGDGGAGAASDALGLPGGGTVEVESPAATVRLDGKIDVSGYDTGLSNSYANGDHGGAGAGGSVYLAAKQLTGSGTVDADGGGYCDERANPEECVNGFGGSGGGGRIATLFEKDGEWTGALEAHGGIDRNYRGESEEQFKGAGGAGTVFTRSVKFKGDGSVQEGTGAFPEGTLTVDGGRSPGAYPPPDGTPLADAWSGPHRRLVITGEARAYGHQLEYAEVDLTHGAVLTTGIEKKAKAIPMSLGLKAQTLDIDATSRLTMTGRGEPGGAAETAEGTGGAAPGESASTLAHGGSHGGAGGAAGLSEEPSAVSGATYDSMETPSQPGGGGAGLGAAPGNSGGGVLDVEVQALDLAGAIESDGQSGDGPTATEPAPFDFEGGGGAGGSVLIHAATLAGGGKITARGGDTCITTQPPLLPGVIGCGTPLGSGGGGGGGRVALYAGAECDWHGTLSAAGGVDSESELEASAEEALVRRGGIGTTFFPTPTGSCSKEEPKPEEHTGEQPKGEEPAHEAATGKTAESPPAGNGTEAPPAPSNLFTILSHRTAAKTGAVSVTVAVSGAGTLSGVESAVLKPAGRHHAARAERVGAARANAPGKGHFTMTFKLSPAASSYLRRHHRLTVTIRVTFTPPGGSPAGHSLTVTISADGRRTG